MNPTLLPPTLTQDEIDALLARIPPQYSGTSLFRRSILVSLLSAGVGTLAYYLATCSFHGTLPLWFFGVLASINMLPVNVWIRRAYRQKTLSALSGTSVFEITTSCLDVIGVADTYVAPEIKTLLTYALPQLSTEELAQLSMQQRGLLCFLLQNHNGPLSAAALRCIEQIGGKTAIAPVERFIKRTKNAALRIAAQKCLDALHERVVLGHDGSQLLRPAMPQTSGDELLRPAAQSKETAPALLLRAASEPSERDAS